MKNRTVHYQTLKHFFSIVCCLLFILTSATVHGAQTQPKPDQSKNTSDQKASAKTAGKKSSPSQLKKNPSPKLSVSI
ncbi:MAG: hypothetical protein NTU74_19950, partial [Deltaproteobacteria bacterium]|nr:hypothetical protein [Deltaproteobacteria bacterium]